MKHRPATSSCFSGIVRLGPSSKTELAVGELVPLSKTDNVAGELVLSVKEEPASVEAVSRHISEAAGTVKRQLYFQDFTGCTYCKYQHEVQR